MPAKKKSNQKTQGESSRNTPSTTLASPTLLPETQTASESKKNRKRKRESSSVPSAEIKKTGNSRAGKLTHTEKKEIATKYVDEIYKKEKKNINRRKALQEKYIPDSLETKPNDVRILKISDCFQKGFEAPMETAISVEYRVEGLGKRYYTFQVKNQDQFEGIIKEIRLIHHPSPSKEKRRLDSLARLLEGNHICVSVFYETETNTVLITANDVCENTHGNYELIESLMRYFSDPVQEKGDRRNLFERAAWVQLQSASKKNGVKISQATARRITNSIHNEVITKKIIDCPIKELIEVAKEGVTTNNIEEQAEIVRAFIFAEKYYRDFCKVEAFFKGKKDLKFDVLKISEKGIHAELGMIDALWERQSIILGRGPQYIGVSRLCCPKCELVIKIINFIIGGGGIFEVRGGHGTLSQKSAAKWKKPGFLQDGKMQHVSEKIEKNFVKFKKHTFISLLLMKKYMRKYVGYLT